MVNQRAIYLFTIAAVIYAVQSVPVRNDKNHAKVARQLVHKANWTAIATISSTFPNLTGFPMLGLKSVADDESGLIYFLLTDLDYSTKDVLKRNNVTLLFTNEQDLSCSRKGVDPMEPTCSRVSISGYLQELKKGSLGYEKSKKEFIRRHPAASNWVEVHNFKLYALEPIQIVLLDGYGGLHLVKVRDYKNVKL